MSTPKLTIASEPSENGDLTYAKLAPGTANGAEAAQVSLRLILASQENSGLQLTKIDVAFDPLPKMPVTMWVSFPTPDGPSGLTMLVPPNGFQPWWGGVKENIVLLAPVSSTAKISVSCKGYDPVTITRSLVQHPTVYPFPLKTDGLGAGEFWQGQSANHVPGIAGWALFAYDLVVVTYDAAQGGWTELKPKGDAAKREDYRAWNRQVYAIADGQVLSVRNDVADRPIAKTLPTWGLFDVNDSPNASNPISGNYVKVLQNNGELVAYAHLRQGSVVVSPNSTVKAGQPLGQVGNSGQSASPNLMIGCCRLTKNDPMVPLLPLAFKEICVVNRDAYQPSIGPWFVFGAKGYALPPDTSLIWPGVTPPDLPSGGGGGIGASPPPLHVREYLAIDPLARIISASLYATLTKPRPTPFSRIQREMPRLVKTLDPAGRRALVERLRTLKNYANALIKLAQKK
jgi:hypothetical protein